MNQDQLEAFKAIRPRLINRLISIWESFMPKTKYLDSIIQSAYDTGFRDGSLDLCFKVETFDYRKNKMGVVSKISPKEVHAPFSGHWVD